MCQCQRIANDPQAMKHRRAAILLAASVAILAGLPNLLLPSHRPAWVSGVVIAIQLLLLILALRQLSLARRRPTPDC